MLRCSVYRRCRPSPTSAPSFTRPSARQTSRLRFVVKLGNLARIKFYAFQDKYLYKKWRLCICRNFIFLLTTFSEPLFLLRSSAILLLLTTVVNFLLLSRNSVSNQNPFRSLKNWQIRIRKKYKSRSFSYIYIKDYKKMSVEYL